MKNKGVGSKNYNSLLDRMAYILVEARTKVVREINKAQVLAYREIGREMIEFQRKGKFRAEYEEELIMRLSKDMTEKFAQGFSAMNLRNMRRFYSGGRRPRLRPETHFGVQARPLAEDECVPMLDGRCRPTGA